MKIIDGKKYYKGSEVATKIGRSYITILNWYAALDSEEYKNLDEKNLPTLPTPYRNLDERKTRYWDEEGVQQLLEFKNSIKLGDLSFFNRNNVWGKRGKDIQRRIDAEQEEIKDEQKEQEKE